MHKDKLFLLAPGFMGDNRREYCPECAEIWGLLGYFPSIKDSFDVLLQPINKPRRQLVELLGQENQNCPTLVLDESSPEFDDCGISIKSSINGSMRFIDNARDIGQYYAQRFGTPFPR